jgi:hypothetical protein
MACTYRVKFIEVSVGINHNVDELLAGTLTQIRLKKEHCELQVPYMLDKRITFSIFKRTLNAIFFSIRVQKRVHVVGIKIEMWCERV